MHGIMMFLFKSGHLSVALKSEHTKNLLIIYFTYQKTT